MQDLTEKNNHRKHYKKIAFWIGGVLLFLLLANFGINYWIQSKLPAIIQERNDTAYDFRFSELQFSLFNSSIAIRGVSIEPKKDYAEPIPLAVSAKVDEVKIIGVNFIKLLTKKDLDAYSLQVNEPDVTLMDSEGPDSVIHSSQLGNVINIHNFEINNGTFKTVDSNQNKQSEIKGINIEIGGVNLSERTLEKNIPFLYQSFEISSDSIFFRLNPSQVLKANQLKANNHLFALKDFKIYSDENKAKADSIPYRILPEVQAPNVSFSGLDWGFSEKDAFYFTARLLNFDSIDVQIGNHPPLPGRKKDSLGNLIPFKLGIEKIRIKDSKLKIGNSLAVQNINLQIDQIQNVPNQKLTLENIILNNPLVTTYSGAKKTQNKTGETIHFQDFIEIKNIAINKGQYRLNQSDNRNLLQVRDIAFQMENIRISPETFSKQIPLTYEKLKISAAALDYNPDAVYSLKAKNLLLDGQSFSLRNFEMKPKISRGQFVRQLKKEKDLYTISADKVAVSDLDWGFTGKDFFIKSPQIQIDQADANIYRSKIPSDDPKKKQLYSKMLRDLSFILEVKRLDLKNSKLVYEEETESSSGAGKLSFGNFNAKIDNIYSGYKRKSLPDVRADIKTNFMNDSRLVAVWTFNPMNRAEKFNIKGSIFSFDARKMTPFVRPYMHATVEGNMQEVRFNFTGNDLNASGDFGIKYDDLKVTLYNKDTGKVRKVLSTVGNFLVKSNTRDQYNEVRIETVTRNQDRSFFNFFWNCVQQGLKQTVLVI